MKHALISVASIIAIVLLVVGGFAFAGPRADVAQANTGVICQVAPIGKSLNLSLTCTRDGVTLGPGEVDLITDGLNVSVSVLDAPTVTATVPGPTTTKTVRPAPVRITRTVRPAPVTVRPDPIVRTETIRPQPVTITETVRPPRVTVTPAPEVVTETVTPRPAPRQTVAPRGKMEPKSGFLSKNIDFGDDEITAGEAGLGLLSILALILTALFVLYAGYIMGWKSGKSHADEEEAHFMRSLLETSKLKR